MPIHIEEMTSEVAVYDGELPLSESQIDKLVGIVLKRLGEKEREAKQIREATRLRPEAMPPIKIGE